eukprot:7465172-Pyramimonas_sp.AAC.1
MASVPARQSCAATQITGASMASVPARQSCAAKHTSQVRQWLQHQHVSRVLPHIHVSASAHLFIPIALTLPKTSNQPLGGPDPP